MTSASATQVLANRANAEKSTGPVTPEGKAKSSMNAVKTGLTSRTVILSAEDAPIYQAHLQRFQTKFEPVTDEEKTLIQFIADHEWRLLAIVPLETGIKAIGRRTLAALFEDEQDPTLREALLQAQIAIVYRRDLANLALQERRLRNHLAADLLQLSEMQAKRKASPAFNLENAANTYKRSIARNLPFDPAFLGFVFSMDQIKEYVAHQTARGYMIGNDPNATKDQFETYYAAWKAKTALKQAA